MDTVGRNKKQVQEYIKNQLQEDQIKARKYQGNGKQRVLNMVDFYRNVKKAAVEFAKKNAKPDIIYASSVHPLALVAGIQLAKKFGVKCICEVRDLWPESIVPCLCCYWNPVLCDSVFQAD